MIGIASAVLLVASGCAVFGRESELDKALAELESMLSGFDADNSDELAAIAAKISEQSRSLLDAQEEFASEFNRQAVDRDVSEEMLTRLVRDYEEDRVALRNQLLHSQDELHAAVPADAWPDVLEVLNKQGRGVVPRRASGG